MLARTKSAIITLPQAQNNEQITVVSSEPIYIHGNKEYKPVSKAGLYSYFEPTNSKFKTVHVDDVSPTWTGKGWITLDQWREMLAFFYWGYEKTRSEQVIQIYYEPNSGEFLFYPYPQYCNGMTVREDETQKVQAREKYVPNDYVFFGTVHHHCNSSAFQSGVDERDEAIGFHATIGDISKNFHDLHCRWIVRSNSGEKITFENNKNDQLKGSNMFSLFNPFKQIVCKTPVYTLLRNELCVRSTNLSFPEHWKESVLSDRQAYQIYGTAANYYNSRSSWDYYRKREEDSKTLRDYYSQYHPQHQETRAKEIIPDGWDTEVEDEIVIPDDWARPFDPVAKKNVFDVLNYNIMTTYSALVPVAVINSLSGIDIRYDKSERMSLQLFYENSLCYPKLPKNEIKKLRSILEGILGNSSAKTFLVPRNGNFFGEILEPWTFDHMNTWFGIVLAERSERYGLSGVVVIEKELPIGLKESDLFEVFFDKINFSRDFLEETVTTIEIWVLRKDGELTFCGKQHRDLDATWEELRVPSTTKYLKPFDCFDVIYHSQKLDANARGCFKAFAKTSIEAFDVSELEHKQAFATCKKEIEEEAQETLDRTFVYSNELDFVTNYYFLLPYLKTEKNKTTSLVKLDTRSFDFFLEKTEAVLIVQELMINPPLFLFALRRACALLTTTKKEVFDKANKSINQSYFTIK